MEKAKIKKASKRERESQLDGSRSPWKPNFTYDGQKAHEKILNLTNY